MRDLIDIPGRLAEARQLCDLTQEEVEATAGLAVSAVSKLETGRAKPNLHSVLPICRVYGLPLRVLMAPADVWRWSPQDAEEVLDDLETLDRRARRELRRRRRDLNIGTPTVAQAADVHQSYIVRLESGEYRRLDLHRLDRCARAIDCTVPELLYPHR